MKWGRNTPSFSTVSLNRLFRLQVEIWVLANVCSIGGWIAIGVVWCNGLGDFIRRKEGWGLHGKGKSRSVRKKGVQRPWASSQRS